MSKTVLSYPHVMKKFNLIKIPFNPSEELIDVLAELSVFEVPTDGLIIATLLSLHDINSYNIPFHNWAVEQIHNSATSLVRYFEYIGADQMSVYEYVFDEICKVFTPYITLIRSNPMISLAHDIDWPSDNGFLILECRSVPYRNLTDSYQQPTI